MAVNQKGRYMEIVKECKRYRKSQRITQEEVAEGLSVYQSNITSIETGRYVPSVVNFMKYLDSIGLEIKLIEK